MTVTSQLVDQLTSTMDDSLNPVEEEDKAAVANTEDKADDAEDADKKAADATDDKGDDDDKSDNAEDDEGYSIDDVENAEEDAETKEEKKEEQEVRQELANLTPEQRYIVENITPITVRGLVGEETKEFTVFSPEQLPAGFKYLDDRDHDIAVRGFTQLESKAVQLQEKFREDAARASSKDFEEANNKADWEDIAFLQREGELPKFKLKPTEAGFEDDPAAKLIQEIMDFKDKRNAQYLKDYQEKGRPFRMIGFEDAFRQYKPAKTTTDKAQEQEDESRKNLSKRTTKTTSTTSKDGVAARVPLRNSRDMFTYIDNLDI